MKRSKLVKFILDTGSFQDEIRNLNSFHGEGKQKGTTETALKTRMEQGKVLYAPMEDHDGRV